MTTFEPVIIGFTCNWCSYRAADLAGTARMKYPPNVRLIRLMCSGRLDPTFVLKALASGADGVLITGCHPGDCHYLEQNYKACGASTCCNAPWPRWASSRSGSNWCGPAPPRAPSCLRRSTRWWRRCAPWGH
jgi:hypothetical protein